MLADRSPLGPVQDGALNTEGGVFPGSLIGPLGYPKPLNANGDAAIVHHEEHVLEPLVELSKKVTRCPLKSELGRGARMDAEFLLKAHGRDAVALPERTVVVHEKLGDDEQGQSPVALRRI